MMPASLRSSCGLLRLWLRALFGGLLRSAGVTDSAKIVSFSSIRRPTERLGSVVGIRQKHLRRGDPDVLAHRSFSHSTVPGRPQWGVSVHFSLRHHLLLPKRVPWRDPGFPKHTHPPCRLTSIRTRHHTGPPWRGGKQGPRLPVTPVAANAPTGRRGHSPRQRVAGGADTPAEEGEVVNRRHGKGDRRDPRAVHRGVATASRSEEAREQSNQQALRLQGDLSPARARPF